jgi:hypothetical protein
MPKNTVPQLIDTVRPNLPAVAKWSRRSVWVVRLWQQGTTHPKAKDRARLVKAVRKHANDLLTLAAKVEHEGKTPSRGR